MLRPDGLWAPHRRALTLGLVLTVTFVASEALAVITVMPVVARDLNGLALYGWAFSSFQLASLVGIVLAGRDADRHGPARPYVAGLVLFATGLLVAGLAPSMWVLVAGRCLQGLGAGAVPAVAYVAIGRSLREAQRARMMAVLSTAWVVPGRRRPGGGSGRGAPVRVALGVPRPDPAWSLVAGPIAVPALVRLGRTEAPPAEEHRIADAVRTAAGAAFVLAALSAHDVLFGLGLAAVGVIVGVAPLRRLLPAGTLRADRSARHHPEPGPPDVRLLRRGRLRHVDHHDRAWPQHPHGGRGRHRLHAGLDRRLAGSRRASTSGGRGRARAGRPRPDPGSARPAWPGSCTPACPSRRRSWPGPSAGLGMGLSYAPISLMMLRAAPARTRGLGVGLAEPGRRPRASRSASGSAAQRWPPSREEHAAGCRRRRSIAFAVAALAAVMALVIAGRLPGSLDTRRRGAYVVDSGRMSRSQASAACQAASACRRCSGPCSPAAGYEPRNFTPARPAWRSRRQSATTSSPTWPDRSMTKQ